MKNKYLFILTIAVISAACNAPAENKDLESKKKELEKSRTEFSELKEKISALEKEISAADPAFAKQLSKAVLVSTFAAEKKSFEHTVEVRGTVESRRNVMITAQSIGEIQRVHVREGQSVTKGQVLVSVNADVVRNTISELQTSLELANSVYEKQARLWEQKIGTELQYLQAKNNKESLDKKLATANAQLEQAIAKAPFAGVVDNLPAKEGEVATPGTPLVRVVSKEDVYIKADVSERFIGKFKAGDPVDIYVPSADKHLRSKISSVGQVINIENRTFEIEVILPRVDFVVKPNQVTLLELRDYVSDNTFAVPTRLIQRDEEGQFIYIVSTRQDGKAYSHRVPVQTGISSESQTEILDGLQGNEQIIDQGYRDVTEGSEIEVASHPNDSSSQNSKAVAKG